MTSETLDLTVDELLTTTRSVRKRLDLEKPVPREVVMECLELALQAPTGSNAQGWQFVFVDDDEKKKAIADIYRTAATPYLDAPRSPRTATAATSGRRWSSTRRSTSTTTCTRFRSC